MGNIWEARHQRAGSIGKGAISRPPQARLGTPSGDLFLYLFPSRFHYKLGCLFPEATEEKEFCLDTGYSHKSELQLVSSPL